MLPGSQIMKYIALSVVTVIVFSSTISVTPASARWQAGTCERCVENEDGSTTCDPGYTIGSSNCGDGSIPILCSYVDCALV